MSTLPELLQDHLSSKYDFDIQVSNPKKTDSNVETWKVSVRTRPVQRHLPAQRIHIDICSIPSYEKQPMTLLNPYGVDMGASGLIIQAQSLAEIFTDKLLAFACRPNRIKHRDLWDISWLHQQTIKPTLSLIPKKLDDREINHAVFKKIYESRLNQLDHPKTKQDFMQEMRRFVPNTTDPSIFEFITHLMRRYLEQIQSLE